jgi:Tfp pilus assembly protein PilX
LQKIQPWVATGLVAFFVALQATWIQRLVDGVVPVDWLTLSVVVPTVLVLVLWELVGLANRMDGLSLDAKQVFDEVESAVHARILDTSKTAKRLEVLGVNLRYAWPSVRQWIDNGTLDGWTIEIAAYRPGSDSLATNRSWANRQWVRLTDTMAKDIEGLTRSPKFQRRTIQLSLYTYSHPPVVRGYRFANGDVFCAFLNFHEDTGKLTGADRRHIHVAGSDLSKLGHLVKDIFASWMLASREKQVVASMADNRSS